MDRSGGYEVWGRKSVAFTPVGSSWSWGMEPTAQPVVPQIKRNERSRGALKGGMVKSRIGKLGPGGRE